jgi:hypothetical protein
MPNLKGIKINIRGEIKRSIKIRHASQNKKVKVIKQAACGEGIQCK